MHHNECREDSRFFCLLLKTFIDFHLAFDDAVPGEAFVDAFAGAGEKFLNQCRVYFETLEGVGKGDRVFFRNENSGFSVDNDIWDATDIACDNRQSKFHSFDEHDSESFGVAFVIDDSREREDVCSPVFVCEIFRRELACENNFGAFFYCGGLRLELFSQVTDTDDADFKFVSG